MRELALFAGAGGGILGGKLLGWRTVCAVEINPYCRSVLLARQRDGILEPFPIWDDVCSFDGSAWRGQVDVVSGGFPCQDISVAGTGTGLEGDRSGLWFEFFRIIGEVRPRYVFIENSPASLFADLSESSPILPRSGLMLDGVCFQLPPLVHVTKGSGYGSLPTPLKSWGRRGPGVSNNLDNLRGSLGTVQRSLAIVKAVGWRWPPSFLEWMMGWPIQWTALRPLETAKFHAWQRAHGICL